ncbi:MAG: thiopurine S-methyltransferase [Methyloprofundus sp.]|nr:thiopurine S-methyltransferase [Methyloprofundus sp.]
MQADFWLERWGQNQIGFHEEEINSHLQKFWSDLKVPSGSKIFVPLCGKSSDMLWLLSQGYQVLGVELSPLAVKSFFAENNLEAQVTDCGAFQQWETEGLSILQGNFFDLASEDLLGCSACYDRASLIALPIEMRQQYVQHLRAIVPTINHTLLVTLEYDQGEMQGPPFSVTESEVRKLFSAVGNIECLFREDILEQNEQFKQRGLTGLTERAYWLSA